MLLPNTTALLNTTPDGEHLYRYPDTCLYFVERDGIWYAYDIDDEECNVFADGNFKQTLAEYQIPDVFYTEFAGLEFDDAFNNHTYVVGE